MADERGLLAGFERVRIISLPSRLDRRRSVAVQLRALGATIDGGNIAFHDAVRPDDAGPFDTVGARGCFLSHLQVLRDARASGAATLLILEDDVGFSRNERAAIPAALAALAQRQWGVFHGGSPVAETATPLTDLAPETPAMLAHFIAFSADAIDRLVPFLEAMLARPAGSADGGPMHVDGAYHWFRRAHPSIGAVAATPHIAHQLSSRTDIHAQRRHDRLAVLDPFLTLLRSARNVWRNLS